jgi:hypothetical protein
MDFPALQQAAEEMKNRVTQLVTQSFASAPAAAQAVAGANMNYNLSLAMVAHFAEAAMAIKKLVDDITEHANLISSSAQQVQEQDALRAAREFNVATTFPTQRSTGSINA